MVIAVLMLMWLIVEGHAQDAKEPVQDGALVEVGVDGRARPGEEVARHLQDVVPA